MRRGFFAKVAIPVVALAMIAAACQRGGGGDGENGNTGGGQARSLLDTVKERGTLRCGVNETVPGFGFVNEAGEIEGFDIEFCKAIAAAVLGDAEAHELIPISAEERFSALRAGNYDVLVRNSTWTSSRDGAEGVAFAHPNFYDGQAIMVATDNSAEGITDLDGTSVCVTSGTTTELNLADYAQANDIELPPVTFEENPQLQEAFLAGRCEAWTSDASQLAGIRSQWPEAEGGPDALRILDEIISKEPLAPAVVDGDTKWFDAVNWVVLGLIAAEEYGVTQDNVADQASNPPNPAVANLLGAPVEDEETGQSAPFDSGLGLDPDFMVDVITAVGNYGEIYDRTVGPDTTLGLARGINAQYYDGGLQYAPPIRGAAPGRRRSGLAPGPPPSYPSPVTDQATASRPAFWRNVRVRRVLFQIGFLLLVGWILRELALNMTYGFRQQGITLDFDFLRQRAGFDLTEGIAYGPNSSFTRALQVGIINTIRVAVTGIVLATVLGLLIGIGRLSSNWLLRNVARVYVEVFRNTPVLIQIIFWYFAVILPLRFTTEEGTQGAFFLSNRGMAVPWPRGRAGGEGWGVWVLAALAAAVALWWWRTKVNERTGKPHHRAPITLLGFVAIAAVGYVLAGGPFEIDLPVVTRGGYEGGIKVSGEFAAILFGLTFYTAAFIAEIIRGSILAVDKGQKEAAMAMGLSRFQQLRLVVLPQAMRIAIPPINSQYLNLTKNSSLAAAIAYPDMVQVGQTIINQAGRPFQVLLIMISVYLILSFAISIVMNILNRTVALRGARR